MLVFKILISILIFLELAYDSKNSIKEYWKYYDRRTLVKRTHMQFILDRMNIEAGQGLWL